jgi:hypothetical protein
MNNLLSQKKLKILLLILILAVLIQGYITFAESNDSYTKTLLHFDGTDGSTQFSDGSGRLWTPNGEVQLDTDRSKFGGASGLFDGSGDFLKTPVTSELSLGYQDFTIDFWVNLNQLPSGDAYNTGEYVLSAGPNYADYGLDFILGSSMIRLNLAYYSSITVSGAWTPATNTWYHVAVVRNGDVFTIYLNGTQIGQNTVNVAMPDYTSYNMAIGRCEPDGESTGYLNGWLEEFRFSKGIARWTSNFTPPTDAYDPVPVPTPLPVPDYGVDDSYTKVLHHFHGQDGSTGFDDETGRLWYTFGNAEIDTAQSKFGGSSINFDGNGDCLRTLYTSDFDIGSSDFTMEAWFNSRSFASAQLIFSKDTWGSNYDWGMLIANNTTLGIHTNGGAWTLMVTVPTMNINTWYHFAIARYNGVITIYLDGVAYGTSTMGITNSSQSYVTLGCAGWNNPNGFMNGYVDEVRLSKGIARYTTNFTPSTSEFAPVPPNPTLTPVPTSRLGLDDNSSNVLLHFNGTNNSNIFIDESGKSWSYGGNSRIHNAQYKFGGASGLFDGNGDYISTPHSSDFDFGSGDFTIDYWAYFTNPNRGYEFIVSHRTAGSYTGWISYLESNNTIAFVADSNGAPNWEFMLNTSVVPSPNTWMHIAVVRHNNDFNIYVNGHSVSYIVSSGAIMDYNVPLTIGSEPAYGVSYNFEGYLDELRISKGIARWTADFTPLNSEYLPPTPTAIPTEANHAPTVANVQVNSGATDINLTANSTTNVQCSASITDSDGFENIQSVTAKFYTGNAGIGASDDINNHYTLTGDTQCIPTGGAGNSEDYVCQFDIYYLANPTDNSVDNWICSITAYDGTDFSSVSSASIEINTLTALDVTSPLDYGLINPGTNTGNTNSSVTVSNVGNSTIDLNILGSDMCTDHPTCAGSVLDVENQEYSTSPFTFGSGTILTTLNHFLDVNISKPTANPSNATQTLYWGLSIPGGQSKGNYTGQNTISAVGN